MAPRPGVALVIDRISEMMDTRRTMERALADLLATYQRAPDPALARKIESLRSASFAYPSAKIP